MLGFSLIHVSKRGPKLWYMTLNILIIIGLYWLGLTLFLTWKGSLIWIIVHVDGLVQERCNSIANALELCLSWTNLSMYSSLILVIFVVYHLFSVMPLPEPMLKYCWLNRFWLNQFQWNWKQNMKIFSQERVFENIACEIAAILFRPQYLCSHNFPSS